MRDPELQATPAGQALLSRTAWAYALPFLTYLLFIALAELLERLGVAPTHLRWLYPVKIGAVVAVLAWCWPHFTELHTLRLKPAVALVALAVGVLVLVLWVSLDADWMIVGAPGGFDPRSGDQLDWRWVAVRIGGAALVVPVMEELFWRAFLMRWIKDPDFASVDPARPGARAFLVSVLLFGVEHNQWLAGIVAGAAYSALYMRHRTLWSPILAHAVSNALLGVWIVRTANWAYW
ncbi:MAG: CAAX prenyl protease-related protein [Pseudomonadota bacterium]